MKRPFAKAILNLATGSTVHPFRNRAELGDRAVGSDFFASVAALTPDSQAIQRLIAHGQGAGLSEESCTCLQVDDRSALTTLSHFRLDRRALQSAIALIQRWGFGAAQVSKGDVYPKAGGNPELGMGNGRVKLGGGLLGVIGALSLNIRSGNDADTDRRSPMEQRLWPSPSPG